LSACCYPGDGGKRGNTRECRVKKLGEKEGFAGRAANEAHPMILFGCPLRPLLNNLDVSLMDNLYTKQNSPKDAVEERNKEMLACAPTEGMKHSRNTDQGIPTLSRLTYSYETYVVKNGSTNAAINTE
jgi:hypothetical protein